MKHKVSLNLLVILLTVVMGSFLFTSCGDKDDRIDDEPENPSVTLRDELSSSSWKLESITGYYSSQTSKWKGEVLEFGPNGTVTEKSVDGYSEKGTYTLSGDRVTFDGIDNLTNAWGRRFTYTLSGSTLKLKDDMGSGMSSTLVFTKL